MSGIGQIDARSRVRALRVIDLMGYEAKAKKEMLRYSRRRNEIIDDLQFTLGNLNERERQYLVEQFDSDLFAQMQDIGIALPWLVPVVLVER